MNDYGIFRSNLRTKYEIMLKSVQVNIAKVQRLLESVRSRNDRNKTLELGWALDNLNDIEKSISGHLNKSDIFRHSTEHSDTGAYGYDINECDRDVNYDLNLGES